MKKKVSKVEFPYSRFPVVVIHKDGKDLEDTKKCYFESMHYAEKYIAKCKFKSKDYQLHIKEGQEEENIKPKRKTKSD